MKNLCKRPIKDQIHSNKLLSYMTLACIILVVITFIIDMVKGQPISASSSTALCSMVICLCALIKRNKDLEEILKEENDKEN